MEKIIEDKFDSFNPISTKNMCSYNINVSKSTYPLDSTHIKCVHIVSGNMMTFKQTLHGFKSGHE